MVDPFRRYHPGVETLGPGVPHDKDRATPLVRKEVLSGSRIARIAMVEETVVPGEDR